MGKRVAAFVAFTLWRQPNVTFIPNNKVRRLSVKRCGRTLSLIKSMATAVKGHRLTNHVLIARGRITVAGSTVAQACWAASGTGRPALLCRICA